MTNLEQLLDRVVKATGADREIDAAIASEFFGVEIKRENKDRNWRMGHRTTKTRKAEPWVALPAFTASVDAAIAFIERVLPGWGWELTEPAVVAGVSPRSRSSARIWPSTSFKDNGSRTAFGDAETIPLALLAAALSALIVKEAGQ